MFRIVKKDNVSNPLLQRLITVVIALVAAGAFIGLCGYSPVTVYTEMVKGSLTSAYCLRQTLIQMVPLLIMALGVAVCFKMQFINIGAEGQFYLAL